MSHDSLPKSRVDSAGKDYFKWLYRTYDLVINVNQHFPEWPVAQQRNIPGGKGIEVFIWRIRVPEFLVSIATCKQFKHNDRGAIWDQNGDGRSVVWKVEVGADTDAIFLGAFGERYNFIRRWDRPCSGNIVKDDGESCIE